MNNQVLTEIESLFKHVFHDEDLMLSPSDSAKTIEGWDSLTHMKLIDAVEKHFNIQFSYKEIRKLEVVNDLVDLVMKHLK